MDCTNLLEYVGYEGNFIQSVTLIDYIKHDNPVASKKNILDMERYYGRLGRPSDNISSSSNYYDYMLKCFNKYYEYYDSDDEEYIEAQKYLEDDAKKFDSLLKEKVETNVVVINIDYPLTNKAYFIFNINNEYNVTYCDLLYLHTIAYKLTYLIEETDDENPGNIPGMLNRAKSSGRFGIWGHCLGDLVYNGHCELTMYNGDNKYGHHVCFKASCDS